MTLDVHTNLFHMGPISRPTLISEIYSVTNEFCHILKGSLYII